MKITVGFSTPHKWKLFSSLIKLWQGTAYSHIFIRRRSEWLDTEYVYQASGLSVNFMAAAEFDKINKTLDCYEIELDPSEVRSMLKFAMENAGKPYGVKQLLGIVLARLGIKSRKFSDGSYSYICSELIAQVLVDYEQITFNKPLDMVTPKDVHEILDKFYATDKIKL